MDVDIGFFLEVMHSIDTYMSLVKANHMTTLMSKCREVQSGLIFPRRKENPVFVDSNNNTIQGVCVCMCFCVPTLPFFH